MTSLPAVERDDASAAFFDAAAHGELLIKQDAQSGTFLAPEARTDPSTGSTDLQPYAAAGTGALVSWAVVHRAPLPALAADVPYFSAIVELTEGPWLMVRLVVSNPANLRIGTPVQVRFVPSGDGAGEIVPVFEPI
ncbi:Zn-ribbon domain-containing OB-fold protein [Mycolicibacterium sp. ELW1]|uniref:Zn-ribbon domain-containing OB-fold protein n=1 Tax=Mycobacteriaceae TaxID=1762 RepID=UPI0011EE2FC8|nr:OB-fold domain-containing protein [Mycobacterium sp. ELW1]QEN12967.1 OB-fold domain-containing protein [Mycobacterium sp. ELW1]